jgi:hypothetical protein
LIEVNQDFDFSPVNPGPGSMELGTMFGMILVEFIILNVITHSLGAPIILDIITHSGPPNIFNLLSFFHYGVVVAAATTTAEVGRVSVESGVDS